MGDDGGWGILLEIGLVVGVIAGLVWLISHLRIV